MLKKLSLNVDKTNFMIFHAPQKKINKSIRIMINNIILKEVNSLKYLGIIIDSSLNFKDHISVISKKISITIGIISKIRHYVNRHIFRQLYYFLIYPHLIYGLIVWGNAYQSTLKPLVKLQNYTLYAHTSPISSIS